MGTKLLTLKRDTPPAAFKMCFFMHIFELISSTIWGKNRSIQTPELLSSALIDVVLNNPASLTERVQPFRWTGVSTWATAVTVQFGLASDDLLTLVASAPSGIFSRQLQSNLSSVAAKFALVPFAKLPQSQRFQVVTLFTSFTLNNTKIYKRHWI